MKMATIAVLIGIMFMVLVVQMFQVANIKGKMAGLAVPGTATRSIGKLDTSGWTANEKMNYEMHGTIPARVGTGSAPTSSGMVGGC